MTHATSSQQSWGFLGTDLIDLVFAPTQQPQPQATQDADLLRLFSFVPGLQEVLFLRQVHALEHATVWGFEQSGKTATAYNYEHRAR